MLQSTHPHDASQLSNSDNHLHLAIAPLSKPAKLPHGANMKQSLLIRGTGSEHDPDLEAAAAHFAMHPFTGAFADPSHEASFAAQLFRSAFPAHVLLMAFILSGGIIWLVFVCSPDLRVFWAVVTLCSSLGLVGRVLLHRMHDSARCQQMGLWTWTVSVVLASTANLGGFISDPATACASTRAAPRLVVLVLVALSIALINGSHGTSFLHKNALIALLMVRDLAIASICGEAAVTVALYDMGALCVGAAVAHIAELYLRNVYAEEKVQEKQRLEVEERLDEEKNRLKERLGEESEDKRRLEERNEQLLAEKERLLYDVQRQCRPHDDDDRSAIRRGLQARPSQAYHPAGSTNPSEVDAAAPLYSPPPSLPPAPPSTAYGSVSAQDETRPRTWDSHGMSVEMAEQELDVMVDEELESINIEMLELIERAAMLPPPPQQLSPPTRTRPVMVDALAEVAHSWHGALSQLMKERVGAGQNEKKRRRLEAGAFAAEGNSLLPGSDSHLVAPPRSVARRDDLNTFAGANTCETSPAFAGVAFQRANVRPLGGKPHPNPQLGTAASRGKPHPACAGEPRPSLHTATTTDPRSSSSGDAEEAACDHSSKCENHERVAAQRKCAECGATETPKWRCNGTLCNACGLKHPKEVIRPASKGKVLELFSFLPMTSSAGKQQFQVPQFPWSVKRLPSKLVPASLSTEA